MQYALILYAFLIKLPMRKIQTNLLILQISWFSNSALDGQFVSVDRSHCESIIHVDILHFHFSVEAEIPQ